MANNDDILNELRKLLKDSDNDFDYQTGYSDIDEILKGTSNIFKKDKSINQKIDDIKNDIEEKLAQKAELDQKLEEAKIKLENARSEKSKAKYQKEIEDSEKELSKLNDELTDLEKKFKTCKKALDHTFESSKLASVSNNIEKVNNGFKNITNSLKGMWQTASDLAKPWAKADVAASKYAKTIGATKAGLDSLRNTSIDNVVHSRIGINFNMSTEELIQAQQSYIQGVGRNLRIDNAAQESLAAMHAVMGNRSNDLAVAFENFGVSIERTGEHAGKMFDTASRKGISFEKYSDNVAKNIKIAQNYTFKNGLKGLESMAQKAVALRMDMGQVASLAEKISTVEGSIDVASKLQVLGGPFASMADPLGMMSEGLMDMEGLMDRITNMIGGLGNFDKATGEVRVSAFNKQRIRAMAQATGMDYSQLMESVNIQAKRHEIEAQLNRSNTARELSDEMQELIKNSATFNKEGQAGISIKGQFKTIDQLKESDYQELIKETQNESADIKDIAITLRSWDDVMQGTVKQKDALQAKMTGWLGNSMKTLANAVGRTNLLLGAIVVGKFIGSFTDIFTKGVRVIKGGFDTFKNIKNLFISGGGVKSVGNYISQGFKNSQYGQIITNTFSKNAASAINSTAGTVGARGMWSANKKGIEREVEKEIIKRTSKKTAQKSITEGTEKFATQGALKAGGKLIKVGGAVGLVGAAGNIITDTLVKKGTWEKGGSAHMAGKTISSGLEGAGLGVAAGSISATLAASTALGTALGSSIPVIGTAIGALTGAIIGFTKVQKVRREQVLDNKLNNLGIKKKGEYGNVALKSINNALSTGEITERTRRKLERKGDFEILAQIDKVKQEKEEEAEAKKDREAERLSKINGGIAKNIARANINVKTALFYGTSFGITGANAEKKNILTKATASMLFPIPGIGRSLADLFGNLATKENNVTITGTKALTGESIESKQLTQENGNVSKYDAQRVQWLEDKVKTLESQTQQQPVSGKIDLNINGTIKLVGANGRGIDVTSELLNNDQFQKELAKIIAGQMTSLSSASNIPFSPKVLSYK